MADEVPEVPAEDSAVAAKPRRKWWPIPLRIWLKYLLGLPLGFVAALALAVMVLDSSIGHRLLADLLAQITFDNGLKVEIARIEGSVYGNARLSGVVLRDPRGVFLRIPAVELDWRPLDWWKSGLDIRRLAIRRGTLSRVPHFIDTGPSNPRWPDRDLRIDQLTIERMTVAKEVLGSERRVDLRASARLSRASAYLAIKGRLGGGDRLDALVDIDKNRNRLDLALDYAAPRGGLLAALTDSTMDRSAHIRGRGTWSSWDGDLTATQGTKRIAALNLSARQGLYTLGGRLWTDPLLSPEDRTRIGPEVALKVQTRLDERMLTGTAFAQSARLTINAKGGADIAGRAFRHMAIEVTGRAPLQIDKDVGLKGAHLDLLLDGEAPTLSAEWKLVTQGLTIDDVLIAGLAAQGKAKREGAKGWRSPVDLAASRIVTDDADLNAQLVRGRAAGVLTLQGKVLQGQGLEMRFPHAALRFALDRRPVAGITLTGQARLHGWPVQGIGAADATGNLKVVIPPGAPPWRLTGPVKGVVPHLTGSALRKIFGESANFAGQVEAGPHHHLVLTRGTLTAPLATASFTGQRGEDGRLALTGQGSHEQYGSFTAQVQFGGKPGVAAESGLAVQLHLADPYPDAGVRDVQLALRQQGEEQYAIDVNGQSALGPFSGLLALDSAGQGSKLSLRRMTISQTTLSGDLALGDAGAQGEIALNGGGVSGTLKLAPKDAQANGQGVDLALTLKNARFGQDQPLSIANGRVTANGLVLRGHTTIGVDVAAQGIGKGRLFVGKLDAHAKLTDGSGRVTASIGGRRGSSFDLNLLADVGPGKVALIAGGTFAGQRIAMPRRAVFTSQSRPDGTGNGWQLAPSQIDYAGGRVVAQGTFGNGASEMKVAMADMPLSLGDIVIADLGLGGKVSGNLAWHRAREGLPGAEGTLAIKGLTRSGLSLTSRPIDLAVAGALRGDVLEARAVASEEGQVRGRLQIRIDQMSPDGDLETRLLHGRLVGQMRYGGPADALWRLMALDAFDLTGPIDIAADITGNLSDPRIRGSLAGNNLRLQSAVTGTDIRQIVARGSFSGSRLTLANLSGQTANGGSVVGSGAVDFTSMGPVAGGGTRGVSLDIKLAGNHAQFINRSDLALVATGPLRILSDGLSGTLAGRLTIDGARWRLGQATAASGLPQIATKEINRRADVAPATNRDMPWRLLVDAAGPGNIRMVGMGLDSRWGANIRLRGMLDNPAIAGEARMVEGIYEFAGKRFELSRGLITFDGSAPPDPHLDMVASSSVSGITASVNVRGTANHPDIAFSSVPALPEEEVLSRLLFGNSITQISAPEAVQLGAALAALHGGGGVDPINKLRRAIGLDRLRIVSADVTTGQQTGVAAGKYLTHHVYAELVSDGKGYSATNLEFRITNWLALLGSASTIGRQSVNARASKDY
ncbi:translocation/assembly module TamB domain-containing protein [Novosphingobium rosa]|uniref:translocation/assembly module TamB domain-containing protein n=1 Tax=Novosphingobium rosa TaxID=76978 RepID=UPI00082B0796|nr:translocation/assembly module TamB domain-containing protein [Novosphingobium rosa]